MNRLQASGNATTDTERLQAAADAGGAELDGEFELLQPVTLNRPWTRLEGIGGARLIGKVHTGPVLHCRNFHQVLFGLEVDSAGRSVGIGILKEADDRPGQHAKIHQWQNVRVTNQPDHGIVVAGSYSATLLSGFQIDHCGGHGLVIDNGSLIGRSVLYRPGGVKAMLGVIHDNGGYAVKCGDDNGTVNYPYRCRFENIDTYRNNLGGEHAWWLYGINCKIVECGLGGDHTVAGAYVAGRSIKLENNRYIKCRQSLGGIEIGNVGADGIATRGIDVDEVYCSGFVADPFATIHPKAREVSIVTLNSQNINSLVDDGAPTQIYTRVGASRG